MRVSWSGGWLLTDEAIVKRARSARSRPGFLQLDAERPGSLRPKEVARICGYDSALITELITWNEEQEIAWRRARDQAADDPEERAACEHERAHAEETVRLLRRTLRKVLLG